MRPPSLSAPARGGFPSYEAAVQAVADLTNGPLPPLDFEGIFAAARKDSETRDAAALIFYHPVKDYYATHPTVDAARAWERHVRGGGIEDFWHNHRLAPDAFRISARASRDFTLPTPPVSPPPF